MVGPGIHSAVKRPAYGLDCYEPIGDDAVFTGSEQELVACDLCSALIEAHRAAYSIHGGKMCPGCAYGELGMR